MQWPLPKLLVYLLNKRRVRAECSANHVPVSNVRWIKKNPICGWKSLKHVGTLELGINMPLGLFKPEHYVGENRAN
jgi:hypothetical protein